LNGVSQDLAKENRAAFTLPAFLRGLMSAVASLAVDRNARGADNRAKFFRPTLED
jgi:hypothetical protein